MSLFQRWRRGALQVLRALLGLAYVAARPSRANAVYAGRYVFWNPSGTGDWRRFAQRPVARAAVPAPYARDPAGSAPAAQWLHSAPAAAGAAAGTSLDTLLEQTGSTAFLVVHAGRLVRESYYNGHARESLTRAFSITKSATSALVGIALEHGWLGDPDAPITRVLPELEAGGYGCVSARHLLQMTAGLRAPWGRSPWADSPLFYWHPDIRGLVLGGRPLVADAGTAFQYNDTATCLLAVLLERAGAIDVAGFFERHLWQPLGSEYDAVWSLDRPGGLANAASGLNARALDLVKLGSLYLNGGTAGGRPVVPRSWVDATVTVPAADLPGRHVPVDGDPRCYSLGWWGHLAANGAYRYWAEGHRGQFVYCCPDRQLVIARFGHEPGHVGSRWPLVLRELADRFAPAA